ncbi:MAG: MaoC family dehydratase [Acidaminococcaceae bacterium]|nr:MaoC family dehydratase [Acidaminococcaceae bacterium]
MQRFTRALCSLEGEQYQQSFIGQITYEQKADYTVAAIAASTIELQMLKTTSKYQNILLTQYAKNHRVLATMKVLLFMKDGAVAAGTKKVQPNGDLPQGASYWRQFSAETIRAFSVAVGDTNGIHLTEYPIVQGFLLAEEFYKWAAQPRWLQLKFVHPVYAEQEIYLVTARIQQQSTRGAINNHDKQSSGSDEKQCSNNDQDGFMCGAFGSLGLHLFSAAFYPGHGDSTDHSS